MRSVKAVADVMTFKTSSALFLKRFTHEVACRAFSGILRRLNAGVDKYVVKKCARRNAVSSVKWGVGSHPGTRRRVSAAENRRLPVTKR